MPDHHDHTEIPIEELLIFDGGDPSSILVCHTLADIQRALGLPTDDPHDDR